MNNCAVRDRINRDRFPDGLCLLLRGTAFCVKINMDLDKHNIREFLRKLYGKIES